MLKRHQSRRSRAADLLTKYLKLEAAGNVAKGVTKAVKSTAYGKIATDAAQRAPKGWLVLAGGVGTAALVARKWRAARPTAA